MTWRLIRAHRTTGSDVVLWGRDIEGCCKESFVIPFRPYFFVLEGDTGMSSLVTGVEHGHVSLYEEPLKKLYVKNPSNVPKARDQFEKHYEADVPFARRLLIDKMLTTGFEPVGDGVIPVDVNAPFSDLVVMYLDVECYQRGNQLPDSDKDPLTCVCLGVDGAYTSVITDDISAVARETEDGIPWTTVHVDHERKLLEFVIGMLQEMQPDVLVAWNMEFDLEYLLARAKVHGMSLPLDGTCTFDLLGTYRGLYRRRSYRLKDIVRDEGITDEDEPSVKYGKMWEEDKGGLLRRNLRHTKWIFEIDRKRKITEYVWSLKSFVGLEDLRDVEFNSVLIDTALLRRSPWVLPSKGKHSKQKAFEGAYVMEPPKGIVENVAAYDFARMYPQIILENRLDPYILGRYRAQHEGEVDWKEYRVFAEGKPSLMLGLVEEMIEERKRLQSGGHEEKLAAIKGLLNSTFGILGSPHYRLYDPLIPTRITEVGRGLIQGLIRQVKEWGHKVVASDTDSVWCVVSKEEAEVLEERINEYLEEGYGVKLEYYAKRILFGGKKRYCFLDEDGELHITGFESVRSDSSNLTRGLQETLFRIVLEGNGRDPVEYLRELVASVRDAPLSDVVITKTLSRDPSEYKMKPYYVRALADSPWAKAEKGVALRIVYARNYSGGVAVYEDEADLPREVQIDYDKIISTQVKAKAENILAMVGRSWNEVEGQNRLF